MSRSIASAEEGQSAKPRAAQAFVAHAKLIGAITLISRFLGMARESIAANYFGSGAVYAAFQVAFIVPNLFRKLLGEGALSAAFIPLYAQAVRREQDGMRPLGEPDAAAFASASVNLLVVVLVLLTIVGEALLAGLVVFVPLPWDYGLAIKLTMIMLPYVLLVCGTAFLGSILQVHHRFAAITFTAVLSNVCLIIAMIAAARRIDLTTDAGQIRAVVWLSVSVLISGVLQVAMIFPSLRAVGFRFQFWGQFWTPAVRRMVQLSVPVALGAAVLQISVFLDKAIAFTLSSAPSRETMILFGHVFPLPMAEGATQRLNWAQYLYQFPLGVFAVALATAIFPKLSADAFDEGRAQFRAVLRRGIEASLFIGLPASIGMIVVRYPMVRLLFERGNFTANDTVLVARSTALYAGAIWAFSLLQILNRAYYALHDTKTPLVLGALNLLLNLAIEIPLLWTPLGESAMAAGTLVAFAVQAVFMVVQLDRRLHGLNLAAMMRPIGKMVLASLVMWAACLGVQRLPLYPHGAGKLNSAIQLFVLMGVGGVVYLAVTHALGLRMLNHVLPRRFQRRSAAA